MPRPLKPNTGFSDWRGKRHSVPALKCPLRAGRRQHPMISHQVEAWGRRGRSVSGSNSYGRSLSGLKAARPRRPSCYVCNVANCRNCSETSACADCQATQGRRGTLAALRLRPGKKRVNPGVLTPCGHGAGKWGSASGLNGGVGYCPQGENPTMSSAVRSSRWIPAILVW